MSETLNFLAAARLQCADREHNESGGHNGTKAEWAIAYALLDLCETLRLIVEEFAGDRA